MKGYVYGICNRQNGTVYVGSSFTEMDSRWASHQSALNAHQHVNKALQSDWDKYGESAFASQVLEVINCETQVDLLKLEQKWIDHYKRGGDCYNIRPAWTVAKGVGRPPKPESEKAQRVTITILPSDLAYLNSIDTNTSAAIRKVIDAARPPTAPTAEPTGSAPATHTKRKEKRQ